MATRRDERAFWDWDGKGPMPKRVNLARWRVCVDTANTMIAYYRGLRRTAMREIRSLTAPH